MNDRAPEPAIRRILVALDASQHSLAALEAASELAESVKAELVGIFVEDINLLHLAGLPFAREISYLPLAARPLDSVSMERQLRLQAARVRQLMAGVAARRQLQWSFRVVRGQVAAELLTAALEADLLALGRASGALTRRVRLGTTAREVLAQITRPVLVLQHGHTICHPVQLVYDGSAAAKRALISALQLAASLGDQLQVMIIGNSAQEAVRLQEELAVQINTQGLRAYYHQLLNPTADDLAKALQTAGGGTLVIGADNALLEGEGLPTLVDAADCAVLLVR